MCLGNISPENGRCLHKTVVEVGLLTNREYSRSSRWLYFSVCCAKTENEGGCPEVACCPRYVALIVASLFNKARWSLRRRSFCFPRRDSPDRKMRYCLKYARDLAFQDSFRWRDSQGSKFLSSACDHLTVFSRLIVT